MLTGAIIVTALAGMPSLDAKYARRAPDRWPAFATAASIIPFAAIAQDRSRLVLSENRPVAAGVAVILWIVLIALHPWALGVDPLRYLH